MSENEANTCIIHCTIKGKQYAVICETEQDANNWIEAYPEVKVDSVQKVFVIYPDWEI